MEIQQSPKNISKLTLQIPPKLQTQVAPLSYLSKEEEEQIQESKQISYQARLLEYLYIQDQRCTDEEDVSESDSFDLDMTEQEDFMDDSGSDESWDMPRRNS